MATLDTSVYDPMLKEYYTDEMVRELAYADNVLLGLFQKVRAEGSEIVQPISYGKPGNASADLATAQTNSTNGAWKGFHLTTVAQYKPARVETRVLIKSLTDRGAFAKAFEVFDNSERSLAEKINRHGYRTTSGSIGKFDGVNTVVAATVGYLTDKADVWNFEEGDVIALAAAASETGGAVRAGTVTVSATDPEAGTVTFSGNITAGVGAAVNTDYCYHAGDYDVCAAGLESWIPTGSTRATKLSTSFYGVTRSASPERLGGVYIDASGASYGDLNEIVTMLTSKVVARGSKPNVIMMHTDRFAQLQLLWLSKHITYDNIAVNVTENVGDRLVRFGTAYPGMRANVGGQIVTVIADRHCPTNKLYVLMTKTWRWWYEGSSLPCLPNKEVGATILQPLSSSDAYEGRFAGYYNLGCSAPGWNGAALLPSL